jgi:membrane-bound serine protease (ClpP class)
VEGLENLDEPLLLVTISILIAVLISLWITNKIGKGNGIFQKIALTSAQDKDKGFIGVPAEFSELVGKTGEAVTVLRPSGKVRIGGKTFDAVSEIGFIEPGSQIRVNKYESGQLYVTKL